MIEEVCQVGSKRGSGEAQGFKQMELGPCPFSALFFGGGFPKLDKKKSGTNLDLGESSLHGHGSKSKFDCHSHIYICI